MASNLTFLESTGGYTEVLEGGTAAVTLSALSNVAYNLLVGNPYLTVSPFGTATAGITLANNGCNYGPDTFTGTVQTTTSGFNEAAIAVGNDTVNSSNMYSLFLNPGKLQAASQFQIPNKYIVILGSGKESCSLLSTVSVAGGPAVLYTDSPVPVGDGHYAGHFAWGFNNTQSYTYGVQMGTYGVTSDITASPFLWEHMKIEGQPTFTGSGGSYDVIFDGIEDGLVFQCGVSTGISWGVNNGSAKIIGGNSSLINLPSTQFSIDDMVLVNIITGHPTNHTQLSISGIGFNGYAGSNIFVNSGPQYVDISAFRINWGIDSLNSQTWSSTTAYIPGAAVVSGGIAYTCIVSNTNVAPPNSSYWTVGASWIGGAGASGGGTYGVGRVILNDIGGDFAISGTVPATLFPAGAGAWATLVNSTGRNQTLAQFLGTGSFINGAVLDSTGLKYNVVNGFVSPVGLISQPFGTFTAFLSTSAVNGVGPGMAGAVTSPVSGTTYTVENDTLLILSSGGTGVSITVVGPNGNTLFSGLPALPYPGAVLFPGYQITFVYTTAPTVQVFGQ